MLQPGSIVVCGAGLKGATFIEGLLQKGINIGSIVTYPQPDDEAQSLDRLRSLALRLSITLTETRHPVPRPESLTFLVGWQYLLPAPTASTVVFHDSLLPRYRGFAPTVTALINGDREIGVTALSPTGSIDEGPIIAQRGVPISYPIKIKTALELQAGLMVEIAADIIEQWRAGELSSTPQREDNATFSIWRDDADYEIEWSKSADAIERFVNAVGHPYAGARTTVSSGETIRVLDVTALPDMLFEIREAGKIWNLNGSHPIVICGSGMLRIDRCCREDGSEFHFERLRARLGPKRWNFGTH
ncbi:methionyl-tRNA formyltransferase [Bradyrhizobium sp. AZCC 2289]|uniref:methionyl-tRNA formyltransferase n=1 Tax=Bradyrhizobium sp. AZCC 2289 TaxID=3117026 RepID=UPI002FF245FE